MEKLNFDTYEDFVYQTTDMFNYIKKMDFGNDVAIVAKYDDATRVIEELIYYGYKIKSININESCFEGYKDEYIISIANIDDEDGIWCEPMLREDGYLTDESTLIYIFDTCSSKVIPCCKGALVCEVSVDEDDDIYDEDSFDDECGFCCGDCCCGEDCDDDCDEDELDDNHGFTVSKSDENGNWHYLSFYTTEDLEISDMQKILKNMGF